jgi:hypothetical protein
MTNENKTGIRRGEMAFIFAIVLGLVVGILIKRVRIGIVIGLGLGLLILFTGILRSKRR